MSTAASLATFEVAYRHVDDDRRAAGSARRPHGRPKVEPRALRPPPGGSALARLGGGHLNPLESLREEQRAAYLYRACAAAEEGTPRAELFRRLAGEAEAQGAIWRAQLTSRGGDTPGPFEPDARARLVAHLVGWLGPRRLRGVLAAMKVRGMAVYSTAGGRSVPTHAPPVAGAPLERRHRGLGSGGNLRAAVFGVNDGLVSNASLILGVAGAGADPRTVVLAGVAGLAAGAFSMAVGEYVSVRSQRELYEHQIALERDELEQYPEAEAQELALIYAAKGVPRRQAEQVAKRLVADPEHALDTLAREELGLNPAELGSPLGAAASSFAAFGAGAVIPMVPFVAGATGALAWSVSIAATALFAIGATMSLFTGRHALASGARMLALGAAAGAVTFAIGKLAGVAVG